MDGDIGNGSQVVLGSDLFMTLIVFFREKSNALWTREVNTSNKILYFNNLLFIQLIEQIYSYIYILQSTLSSKLLDVGNRFLSSQSLYWTS